MPKVLFFFLLEHSKLTTRDVKAVEKNIKTRGYFLLTCFIGGVRLHYDTRSVYVS